MTRPYGPVVGLEEHLVTPAVLRAWEALPPDRQDLSLLASRDGASGRALADFGAGRLAAMDASGVDVQVLSLSTPGLQGLDTALALALQRETNDEIAALVAERPRRLGGWATLATQAPAAAADELRRAVTELGLDGAMVFGRTGDRHLDHPTLTPLLEAAAELRAPLYLHPQSPPQAVRAAYYDGYGSALSAAFATHGVGWHYDAGVEILRLVLGGVLDRFPDLQVVTGHWGEMVLFYLDRVDQLGDVGHLQRRPSEYLRSNLLVTPSGVLSERYLRWTAEVLGLDRVLMATDHPFVPLAPGAVTDFLDSADLTDDQRANLAHGTWDRLRAGIRR